MDWIIYEFYCAKGLFITEILSITYNDVGFFNKLGLCNSVFIMIIKYMY